MYKNKHGLWIKLIIALVVAALVIFVLEVTNTTHLFHKSAVVRAPAKPLTKLPATTSPANTGNKVPSTPTTVEKGTATDQNGKVPSNEPTDPAKWSKSASGVITLKRPAANSTLKSGDTISGSASVPQVQYRLIDNQVGVISQGPISVVNGNFTAAVNFTPAGSNGRLDVFSTDATGRELNEVQIPVNF